MRIEWLVGEEDATQLLLFAEDSDVGERLDRFISTGAEVTRSAATKLIEDGNVLLGETRLSKNYRMRVGDTVEVTLPAPAPAEALPEDIPLDVVYEDSDIIVINKPVGMVVHPAVGNPTGTLVNALLYHCGSSLSGVGGVVRPGIVHRIDKNTSGLLVVAKNDEAHLFLSEQLKGHRINRIYTAIALGSFKESCGTVDAPIGRHPVDRKRMAVIKDPALRARDAVTHWSVQESGSCDGTSFSLLRCELETGRTHQIRVHMASIGHPLLGDDVYGGDHTRFQAKRKDLICGQCLHAGELELVHPRTREQMHFEAPMPCEMQRIREILFGKDTQ